MSNEKPDASFISYKILTGANAKEATRMQIQTSFQECLTLGFGIAEAGGTDSDGFSVLLESIIEDGFSIGAFDSKSGELVGVCFNKLHTKAERDTPAPLEENVEENMKHPATLDLMRFIFKIEATVDLYELYNVPSALEIFYIGVDSRYRRYGIGYNLMRSSLEMARKIGLDRGDVAVPDVAYGVFTSNYSQALGEKFGFEWLSSIRYEDYVCHDGKTLADRIGPVHQTVKLGARRL